MVEVSGNYEALMDLVAMREEELHPDLVPWVEESETFGSMLRHPLVYQIFPINGAANRVYAAKSLALAAAEANQDWPACVWMHERPYRFKALLDYCVGRDDEDNIIPLVTVPEHWDLAADVWVDSENIQQNDDEWRALFDNGANGLWLGTDEERAAFDALPDPISAWRGGTVGDWSWTTDIRVAEFFSRRSHYPVRHAMIPKADVFGYFTRRSESELLVRLTDERRPLVYP